MLRADVLALAFRFGWDGDGEVGEELASALAESVKAHDDVQRYVLAVGRRQVELRGTQAARVEGLNAWLRAERTAWLKSASKRLLQEAAKKHREAEAGRRKGRGDVAHRLFSVKNRFEFIAGALDDVAAHEYDGDE